MDKRRTNEPLLVGINIKVSEREIAAFEDFVRRGLFKSKSAAGRHLLVKALRAEGIDADGKR